ncbi:hypothetical protein [Bdellovibrio sp. HCB337]|uniref:hypothetical protein n=1 Tax=Bdellovibrio sp. HCB337 TaxID=3394358 RepID=UPI0039A77F97
MTTSRRLPSSLLILACIFIIFQNCARPGAFAPAGDAEVQPPVDVQGPASPDIDASYEKAVSIAQLAQAWLTDGCNTTSYHQDPTDKTLFWGRRLKYSGLSGEISTNECTWKTWGVALYRADFTKRKLTFLRFALKPSVAIGGGRTLTTAYDPTVAIIAGVKYAAFECHGTGFPGSVGACVGPVDSNNNIIASKTRVYVDGIASRDSSAYASASVPKIFTALDGKAYLSWTQVVINKTDGKWRKLSSRTIPFNVSMGMIASDALGPFDIYNPLTVPGTADLFDIKQIVAGRYLFVGVRGENGCLSPVNTQTGCYRLEIGSVNNLTHKAFDSYTQAVYLLPDNPSEYGRWAYDPLQKTWGVFGYFLRKSGTTTGQTLNPGLYFIPVANSGNDLPVKNTFICNPATQPAPHWGVKNGKCLRSCGGLGGTRGFTTACSLNGMIDAGPAYDVPYCCK